jgi:3-oxoadipate enol-lactonase
MTYTSFSKNILKCFPRSTYLLNDMYVLLLHLCHNGEMSIIHINDIDTYYEITGQGEPLLFIHGLGSSARNWEWQVEYFARQYRVIAYDVRGHGRSSKPPGPYSMGTFAKDAAALLTGLEIAPAHVAGISMGGMIAFELAVRYPELLKSMVIVNSVPEVRVTSPREYLEMWPRFLILKALGVRRMGMALGKRLFPRPEQEETRRIFVERWAQNDRRAYQDALRAVLGWSVEARLGEIHCPVLVIAAEQDYWPLDVKQAYVKKMPDARLVVIADARHAVAVEKPEEFNRILDNFLASQMPL